MLKRPHVVIFNPDQWRGDVLGHVGNHAAVTPHLDSAAREDFVSFRQAFCQNPVCTPSRCSFMTGWYPHVRGHRSLFHMLQPDEPCLLKTMKQNGYHVWWGGKNDLVPAQNGYGAYCDVKYQPTDPREADTHGLLHKTAIGSTTQPSGYYSMQLGKLEAKTESSRRRGVYYDGDWANVLGAVDHIKSAPKNLPPDQPLCIFLPLNYPHPPYAVEEPYYSQIDRHKLPPRRPAPDWAKMPSLLRGIAQRQDLGGWSEAQWTELRATYYGMCARVDAQFAMVMNALREAGLYDDTAVFFFSDHGDFTGDYGLVEKTQNTFEDCLTRVPLLVKPPKGQPVKARVSGALVELIDVPATIYDYCGIEPGYTHFGQSLRGVVADERDCHREAVFSEGGRLGEELHASEGQSGIQNDPTSPYWPRVGLQQKVPEHTKAAMCRTERYKYVRRLDEPDELYDLQTDPGELTNRIDDPALKPALADLQNRMLDWYQRTCDVVPHEADKRK